MAFFGRVEGQNTTGLSTFIYILQLWNGILPSDAVKYYSFERAYLKKKNSSYKYIILLLISSDQYVLLN